MTQVTKDKPITIKVTEAQHEHWMQACRREGTTISNKVRMLLVATYGQPEPESTAAKESK